MSSLVHPLLLDAEVGVALLRNSRDELESCARLARTLAADVNWQSGAVRHVYERMDGIERRLEQLAAGADAAIADIHAERRRYVAGLALLGA
ncbi:hypothetical protein ACPW96_13560 [Micromonospora sp. DT81.3]|uniref:hypothetical protein n=1 Tax=Micromonospora sp. DT81.3 TaxID=3416523 RepID=UPI003CF48463